MSETVEVLLRNVVSTIGEGPHWDDVTQTLLFVDLTAGDVIRWHYHTGTAEKMNIGPCTSFVIPCKDGGYVGSCGKDIVHYTWGARMKTVLSRISTETASRFNDGKCDSNGRLWAGTMPTATKKMPFMEQSLYSYGVDGAVRCHKDGVSLSNGIAWSGDNTEMYYVDTIPRVLMAFKFDSQKGTLSNERVVLNLNDAGSPEEVGWPDGMTIDTDDKLWLACFGGGKVIRVDPKSGEVLRTIRFPVKRIASCCFGGPELNELFVTTAKFKYTKQEPDEELAGSVFRVKGLGVKGHKANMFGGQSIGKPNL